MKDLRHKIINTFAVMISEDASKIIENTSMPARTL
jgi:hypothetical protein